MAHAEELLRFANEAEPPQKQEFQFLPEAGEPWKILIVDDDEEIHTLTLLLLKKFTFDGRGLSFVHGYSGSDAIRLVQEHADAALMLLDVVMEHEESGLEAVRHIRTVLHNRALRIILRTGRASQVPEREVIAHYDINDYKDKSDLTAQKLITAITLGLRNYRDLRTIETLAASNEQLEERVWQRTRELTETNTTLHLKVEEHRRSENALRQSEARLAQAQRIAHLGNWEWDLATGNITWSDEITRILGHPPIPSGTPCDTFEESIHPDDRNRVRDVVRTSLEKRLPYEILHRIVRPDGEIRSVHALCEVLRDNTGTPLRLMGTVHDITERQRAEEELRNTTEAFQTVMAGVEDQLRITTKVFENAVEGIIICDADYVIQYVNPAFTAITGYTAREAVGRSPRALLRSNRHEADFYDNMKTELAAQGRWQGEVWNRRKNGEAFPEQLTITAISNNQGQVTHFISVFHDLSDIKRSQEALHYNTNYDALTGLPNRNLFRDRLNQSLVQARESSSTLGIVMFGLDQFKKINESMGYTAGDRLLQEAVNRLKGCLRGEDTLSRLGGDEFALILPSSPGIRQVVRTVRQLASEIARPYQIDNEQLHMTASFGISFFPEDGLDAFNLLKCADIAMNRVKSGGRNSFQFYTTAMDAETARRITLENHLRRALDQREFHLQYQPKVETASGRITSMEALARWNHPELGNISPGEFIPIAEETGWIIPLGEWILESACRQTAIWHREGHSYLRVAVNLSARQFQQEKLVRMIASTLDATGLPPQALELEITESMVMGNVERSIAIMEELREMGIAISMDDFGTGYSSLSYLKRFPIHALKIDRSFMQDLGPNSSGAAITSAIIAMAHRLNLRVVAEGVETDEHLNFLKEHQADEWQGYLFSRPLAPEAFGKLLSDHSSPQP